MPEVVNRRGLWWQSFAELPCHYDGGRRSSEFTAIFSSVGNARALGRGHSPGAFTLSSVTWQLHWQTTFLPEEKEAVWGEQVARGWRRCWGRGGLRTDQSGRSSLACALDTHSHTHTHSAVAGACEIATLTRLWGGRRWLARKAVRSLRITGEPNVNHRLLLRPDCLAQTLNHYVNYADDLWSALSHGLSPNPPRTACAGSRWQPDVALDF